MVQLLQTDSTVCRLMPDYKISATALLKMITEVTTFIIFFTLNLLSKGKAKHQSCYELKLIIRFTEM